MGHLQDGHLQNDGPTFATVIQRTERRLDMTLEELEKRIQAVEDMEEIKKLHGGYIFPLSDKLHEQMVDYFAPDAMAQISSPEMLKGIEEIRKHFLEVIAERGAPRGDRFSVRLLSPLKRTRQRDIGPCFGPGLSALAGT